jgi:hypothetical protein
MISRGSVTDVANMRGWASANKVIALFATMGGAPDSCGNAYINQIYG